MERRKKNGISGSLAMMMFLEMMGSLVFAFNAPRCATVAQSVMCTIAALACCAVLAYQIDHLDKD